MASIDLQHTWRHGGLHQVGTAPKATRFQWVNAASGYEIRQGAREMVGDHIDPKRFEARNERGEIVAINGVPAPHLSRFQCAFGIFAMGK
jgi:hypothetical protein